MSEGLDTFDNLSVDKKNLAEEVQTTITNKEESDSEEDMEDKEEKMEMDN